MEMAQQLLCPPSHHRHKHSTACSGRETQKLLNGTELYSCLVAKVLPLATGAAFVVTEEVALWSSTCFYADIYIR